MARRTAATPHVRLARAVVDTEGTQTLRRASSTRPATPRPGARRRSRSTAPSRSTRPRGPEPAWRKTNFATTVTGTDATSGSGVAHRVQARRRRPSSTTPRVSITAEGPHKLETRVDRRRRQRLRLAHRHDRHRQGRPDAGRRLRRRRLAQHAGRLRRHRRRRRLRPADADRRRSAPARPTRSPTAHYTVDADGAWTDQLPRRRRRRQRGRRQGRRQDRPRPPRRAAVTCVAGRRDDLASAPPSGGRRRSGLAALAYSVNGSAPVADRHRRARSRSTKGTVVVYATDDAGNVGRLGAGHARRPHAAADDDADERSTPRTTQRGRAAAQGRLRLRAPARPALDLVACRPDDRRPAPARARQGHVPVRDQGHLGKKTKTVTKTQTTSSRLLDSASASRVAAPPTKATVDADGAHASPASAGSPTPPAPRSSDIASGLTFPARLQQSSQAS